MLARPTHQQIVLRNIDSGVHKLLVGDLEQPCIISHCAKGMVGPVEDVCPEAKGRHTAAHIAQLPACCMRDQALKMRAVAQCSGRFMQQDRCFHGMLCVLGAVHQLGGMTYAMQLLQVLLPLIQGQPPLLE